MKIALFTDGIYPYVIGGMQRHSFYLAKYLAGKGVYIDLYHTNKSGLDIDKLSCFTEDERKYIVSIVIPFEDRSKLPGHYLSASYHYSRLIFYEFLKRKDVDFIYTKGFTGWYLIKQKSKQNLYPPVGVNFHGYEMFQKAANFRSWLEQLLLFRLPVKYIVNHSDAVFSYGGKITQLVSKLITNKNVKVCEIPTGIDETWLVNQVNPTQAIRKFIFVGRFERRKGIEELTEVIKELIPDHNFYFEFIGPVPPQAQIKNPKVRYWGSVTATEKMKAIFDSADILICPSHSEGMPNVIVEAMSRGLAVIATDVGAVNRVVNNNNGWLIQPADKKELKKTFVAALQEAPEIIDRKKAEALKTVKQQFLWSHVADKHIHVLQQLVIK